MNYEEEYVGGVSSVSSVDSTSALAIWIAVCSASLKTPRVFLPKVLCPVSHSSSSWGNLSASTDLFVNEQEEAYPVGGTAPANCVLDYGQQFDSVGNDVGGACGLNPSVAGDPTPDGKPDGFSNPRRHYQALELEANKSLSHNFMVRCELSLCQAVRQLRGAVPQ